MLESPVTREAYDLNVPMVTAAGSCPAFSAFGVDAPNVFIDTVKPAEDGSGDLILRLYEAKRADTDCRLRIGVPVRRAYLCSMLEENQEELPVQNGCAELHFRTFEVKTIRIQR